MREEVSIIQQFHQAFSNTPTCGRIFLSDERIYDLRLTAHNIYCWTMWVIHVQYVAGRVPKKVAEGKASSFAV